MWTDRHRTRHAARLKDVVAQTGLDEVARFLERADPPDSPAATPARRILAGIAWHLRVGGAWRALSPGFPPWRKVYGWFRRWIKKGLFEALMRALARRQRRRCGRRPTPRLAIIDTQSVKCIGVRGPRGYDGAKKLVGRKRVALVDAEGHVLALAVVPANVQDRDTLPALDDGKETWPSLRLAIFDGAFTAKRCQEWCLVHGMRHRVVEKQPDQKGFVVLERRWVVERTFGWLSHWDGLHRERASRLDVATGRLAWREDLDRWLQPFLAGLSHPARRAMCPLYVAGLIGLGDRKSVQPMAARADEVAYDRLHHFIAAGIWDEAPLQQALLGEADRLVGGSDAILVVDDTALPKKGNRSVGVALQYATTLGKTANCQTLVSLTLARGEVPVAVGLRLFLPET